MLVALAMREVEDPARHERRGAVGREVAEADCQERARPVDGKLQPDLGEAEDLERLLERIGVERERERVVGALVGGEVGRLALRAPDARLGPVGLEAEELARLVERELPDARADVR